MITPPQIIKFSEQLTAVVHLTIPREQIREVMGPGRRELMEALKAQGITPSGQWFTHHLKMDPATFDFQIGVPVAKAVNPIGRVTSSFLPAGTVARTVYRGSYEGLGSAWKEFGAWISAQGKTAGPSLWETYLTDPSSNPDPTTWQTELTRPLVD